MNTVINTLISIPADEIYRSTIQFGKGEVVYFSNQKLGTHIISKILEGQLNFSNESEVSRSNIRRNVAYISDKNYLWTRESAKQNVDLYLESIGLSTGNNRESIEKLNINWQHKVSELDPVQRHLLQIAIGLSKDPEIILYEDSAQLHSIPVYKRIMSVMYDLVKDKGLTLLSNVTSSNLRELYPGRIIH